ncbi:MAG: CpsD/CapB family tyrosine-protein kinase [Oscillospiraceae bacterium]|nr:CpsD/CapB family tyrosine-protein kinase [Oscillospiraceae bacterium]
MSGAAETAKTAKGKPGGKKGAPRAKAPEKKETEPKTGERQTKGAASGARGGKKSAPRTEETPGQAAPAAQAGAVETGQAAPGAASPEAPGGQTAASAPERPAYKGGGQTKKAGGRHLAGASESRNILGGKLPSAAAEEYKMLRTAVSFAAAVSGGGCKAIGVTSPLPSEGKSVTCVNLAITFALMDLRVLLLDCDMRRPVIARALNLQASPGVSNMLAGASAPGDILQRVERGGAGFDVIVSGDIPPNPSELLGSARAGDVFGELARGYDYIFADLPPTALVSDAAALSKTLSGFVMVVRAGQTRRDDVRRSAELLKLAGANIFGFVLNGAPRADGKRYYAYGYGRRGGEDG